MTTACDLRVRALELAVDSCRSSGGDVLERAQKFFDFMFNTEGRIELAKGVQALLDDDAKSTAAISYGGLPSGGRMVPRHVPEGDLPWRVVPPVPVSKHGEIT